MTIKTHIKAGPGTQTGGGTGGDDGSGTSGGLK